MKCLTVCSNSQAQPAAAAAQPAAEAATQAAPQAADVEQRIMQTALDLKNKTQLNYKIQPGDLLEITVFKETDMNRTVRISGNGTITFPLAGNLKLANLSVPEAEALLAQKLSEYLVKPQ